jgi:hypothetical protein
MFWTPFTGSEVKPQMQVRPLPAFKDIKPDGADINGEITPWGYTAEFKLPWSNLPPFSPDDGAVIGIDCELCSSDGGRRVDRTFVYSSPAAVNTPAAFGRVKLVEKIKLGDFEPLGRALLPMSLTKGANYDWLYGTVCVSPTIEKTVGKLDGKIVDAAGKVRKTSTGFRKVVPGTDFALWWHRWELFDLTPGAYTIVVTALDKEGRVITERTEKLQHDVAAPPKESDKPPPPKKDDDPADSKAKEKDKPPPSKKDDDPSPPKKDDDPDSKKKDKSPPPKEGDKPAPPKNGDDPSDSKKKDQPPPPKKDDDPAKEDKPPPKESDTPSSKEGDPLEPKDSPDADES